MMAVQQCSECAEKVSGKADVCPHCGAPGPKKKGKEVPQWCAWVMLAPVMVLVVIVLGISMSGQHDPASNQVDNLIDRTDELEVGGDTGMAFVMAKSFVEDSLKSPGTADFGSVWGGTYQMPDDCVTDLGDDKYRVTGWVDAENSFGATVRIDFVCELEYVGDDNWRLIDLQMDQR